MSRGRHRVEPSSGQAAPRVLGQGRFVTRLSPRVLVAAGGVLVLALTAGALVRSGSGADRATMLVAASPAPSSAAPVTPRAPERVSRDRPLAPPPTGPTMAATATAPKGAPRATVVGRRWATADLNVRARPTTDSRRVGSLKAITRVGITGVTRSGWAQVVVDGRTGWVRSSHLAKAKPKRPKSPGPSDAECAISSDIEQHLTANARAVYRAVCAAYGDEVSSFGGYRRGDGGDHGSGRAVDVMVSGPPGWRIARFVQTHARALGVTYVIYEQKIWMAGDPTGRWEVMEDRGSPTANHYDHVHVSVR